MTRILNAKLVLTVLLGIVYLGGLIWALVHGKLDINSYLNGVGPIFGLSWAFWFKDSSGSSAP